MIGAMHRHRYSESAQLAFTWALVAALKEKSAQINPVHLLAGIVQEKPRIISRRKLARVGLVLPRSELTEVAQFIDSRSGGSEARSSPAQGFSFWITGSPSPTLRRAAEIARRYSESQGNRSIGVIHLLWGIYQADKALRNKLQRAGLTKSHLDSLCRSYKDGEEGESAAELMEKTGHRSSRNGIGYDLHRLEAGRKLILGGVEVPFEKGPAGHSDGDALAHAICDALLGAAGLGDIGTHFPDTDPKWKSVSSLMFLERVRQLLDKKSLRITHIDAVVIAERPKLGPHFSAMRGALAKSLGISPQQINLKAKTNEGVDAIGRGEAIAAQAIATLEG